MPNSARQDDARSPSSTHSRSNSIGSDASPSTRRPSVFASFPALRPAPAYVALASASQLATEHQSSRIHDEVLEHSGDSEPEAEGALFSEKALLMINTFLDQMLYNLLTTAKSTSLTHLRSAVELVLKGKLSRLAITTANEELEELLRGEAEELAASSDETECNTRENIDLVFKRTRLRIMVYARLGEMEDEDEQAYLQDESLWLQDGASDAYLESNGLLPWTATIFLTSILEYLAEQCVEVAGQAAYSRVALRRSGNATPTFGPRSSSEEQRILIEEHDVERIALNSTLGRLWRTWRKTVRAPRTIGFISMQTVSAPQSIQISARTSISTLRPSSGIDTANETQVRSGAVDDINPPKHNAHTRPARRSFDKNTYSKLGRLNQSSEEEPNGSKKRTRQNPHHNIPPLVITSSPNEHSLLSDSRDDSYHAAPINEIESYARQSRHVESRSFEGELELETVSESRDGLSADRDLAVVPVSGVLHLHFPPNNSRKSLHRGDTTRDENVTRLDFASPASTSGEAGPQSTRSPGLDTVLTRKSDPIWTDDHQQSNFKNDQFQRDDNANENGTSEMTSGLWPKGSSGRYQPNAANTTAPLTIRTMQDGFQTNGGLQAMGPVNGSNTRGSLLQGNHRLPLLTTPNILRVVTAREITPISDGGYTPTPLSPRQSGTSYEPITPVTGASRSISPPASPRPAMANSQTSKEGFIAREPRIQTVSTRDFADFIRSTAPTEDQLRVAPIVVSPTTLPSGGTKSMSFTNSPSHESSTFKSNSINNGRGSFSGMPDPAVHPAMRNSGELSDKRSFLAESAGHSPVAARTRNPSLEPRDPVIRGRSNDDLIAFLREGPPGANYPKPSPREYMERRTADKFNMATSPISPTRTSDLTFASQSKHESVNSQSALLSQAAMNANKAEQSAHSTIKVPREATFLQAGLKRPRRIKDPYAIPSDNEDEDVLTALPKKSLVDESLIDFLHNTGPPVMEERSGRRPSVEGRTTPSPGALIRAGSQKLLSLRTAPKPSDVTETSSPSAPIADRISLDSMPHLGEFLSGRTSVQSSRMSSDMLGTKYTDFDSRIPQANKDRNLRSKQDNRGHVVRDFWRKIAA